MKLRTITLLAALLLAASQLMAQSMTVEGAGPGSFSPEELIEDICLGDGIQVTNIEFEGTEIAVGSFGGGQVDIGLEQGFVMTTGRVESNLIGNGVDRPALSTASFTNGSDAFSDFLPSIANEDDILDVAVFTIDFVPTGDTVMFRYVFASDEYPTFVCSSFNDVFGFFLEGQDPASGANSVKNLAQVPGTELPVSINSVNGGTPGSYLGSDPEFCSESLNGSLDYAALFNVNPASSFPVYNGYTDVFVAKSAVVPCQPYRMTLVIADVGDALWDSGIFFEAKSFCSFTGGSHSDTEALVLTEDCAPQELELDLSDFPSEEYPLSYSISGTATAGEDFAELPLEGTIATPSESWTLAAGIVNDDVAESTEQLEVTISGTNCRQKTFDILIVDPIKISGPALTACADEPVELVATEDSLLLADYDFRWSNGMEGPNITVNPEQTTTYTLTYENGTSSCTADFTVNVTPEETAVSATINEGESYSLAGNTFSAAGQYEVLLASEAGCDSLIRLDLQLNTVSTTLTDSIAIGQSVNRCIDTEALQQVSSFTNICSSDGIDISLDGSTACVSYQGQSAGLSEACILACSDNGTCDTTFLEISVFDNILDAVDDYDTTLYNEPVVVDVLANDWTAITVLTDQYIVSQPAYGELSLQADGSLAYEPQLVACLQEDVFQYAICNEFGCDTASVYLFLDDAEGACDLVWPGDIGNDGIVNQMDQWAIALAYGETGPIRPNATVEWIGQPAIDWPSTLTFAYEFNNKFTDCNGNGIINEEDMDVIMLNWGKTHQLSPTIYDFPEEAIPNQLSTAASQEASFELRASLGSVEEPVRDAYGWSTTLQFDPAKVSKLHFRTDGSWLGTVGEDMLFLEKIDYNTGQAVVSLARKDHNGRNGFGQLGTLQLRCPSGDCGEIVLRDQRLLRSDASVTEISGGSSWSASLTAAEEANPASIRLFPNPVEQQLTLESPAAGSARLLNSAGQPVWENQLTAGNNTVDMQGLPAGLYLLQLQVRNELIYRKVIKR